MRHNSVVSGFSKSTGILRVDGLSIGPLGFGVCIEYIYIYIYIYI